jgi:hypothetical protein
LANLPRDGWEGERRISSKKAKKKLKKENEKEE